MNKWVIGGIGLVLGGVIGFFAGKKTYEEYYKIVADEEIESVTEAYEEAINNITCGNCGEVVNVINVITESDEHELNPKTRSTIQSMKGDNRYDKAKTNYHLVNRGRIEDKDKLDEEGEDNGDNETILVVGDAYQGEYGDDGLYVRSGEFPYLITDIEYNEEFDQHDKERLYYYMLDDTLVNSNEEIIDNIEELVSYDAIAQLDFQSSVWVRNEAWGIDFEIVSIKGRFSELVAGIAESPREKYNKKSRTRGKRRNE